MPGRSAAQRQPGDSSTSPRYVARELVAIFGKQHAGTQSWALGYALKGASMCDPIRARPGDSSEPIRRRALLGSEREDSNLRRFISATPAPQPRLRNPGRTGPRP